MIFDWTIDFGTVVQAAVLIGVIIRSHVAHRERLARIELRIQFLEDAVDNASR